MNFKEFLRKIAIQFFVAFTATMAITILILKYSSSKQPDISYIFLGRLMLLSLCAVLPGFVYYSQDELSRKSWWLRTVIHTFLLEIILLFLGHLWEMYHGFKAMVLFAVIILIVDLFVRCVSYLSDRTTADEVNKALALRREYIDTEKIK